MGRPFFCLALMIGNQDLGTFVFQGFCKRTQFPVGLIIGPEKQNWIAGSNQRHRPMLKFRTAKRLGLQITSLFEL